jgi:hypothetical protein
MAVRIADAKASAHVLLQACPGIGSDLDIGGFRHKLIFFLKKDPSEITETELNQMMRYISWRNDQLSLADVIIQRLGLDMPSTQAIRTWNKHEWVEKQKVATRLRFAINTLAIQAAQIFETTEPESVTWIWPCEYVAAALAMKLGNIRDVNAEIPKMEEIRDWMFHGVVRA